MPAEAYRDFLDKKVFTVIDHKSDTIKWSKQSEQSTFLLLWEVWRTHFGVLPFCFVVEYFGLIV